jgi:hypothetical protein
METRISQRPSRAPGRRSRAPGGRRSSQSPLRPADVRAFGRALDLLVRAIRMSTQNLEQAAQRAHGLWRDLRFQPIDVEATEARMKGVALSTPEQELRWVLPSFMAGLRRIAPRPELSEMELRNFAEALAQLDPDVGSIERFRDWTWSGAATGFELDLQSSFMEALDDAAMEREVDANDALDAMRAAALRSAAARAALLSARSLAKAADRDELDVPLCAPETRADDPEFSLPAAVADPLRAGCDDAAAWRLAEVRLVLRQAPLQDTLRPERFAKRVHEALQSATPPEALGVLDALAQRARHREPFAMDLLAALDAPSFGEALGAVLWSDVTVARRALEVLLALGPVASRAAAVALREAAGREAAWSAALPGLVSAAGGRLDALLLEGDDVPSAGAVTALCGAYGARGAEALWARALGGGHAWLGRPFATLCRALVDAGLGARMLVPVARDRGADVSLRLEVLDVLGGSPELLAQAVAWRMGELLEPPVIRERLKSLRGAT